VKRTQRCPKCTGQRLWVVEKFRVPAEAAEGVPLAVVPHQSQGASRFAIGRVNPQGTFNLWLCEACALSALQVLVALPMLASIVTRRPLPAPSARTRGALATALVVALALASVAVSLSRSR